MPDKTQVGIANCFGSGYDTKERFISYWHQINEIISLEPSRILEIGKGNGFVSSYLKSKNFKVTTFDFDNRLNPDVVGNVMDMPFESNSFDVIACCQVLEHLPFEYFTKAIEEIYRVSAHYSVISLPDAGTLLHIDLKVPKFGRLSKLIELPLNFKKHMFDGEHYWEIRKKGFSLKMINNILNETKFKIVKNYRIYENPYHRIFVLEK